MKRLAATLSPVSLGVGATNWQAPSFNPDLGMFYVGTSRTYAMYYLTDTDDHPEGWGGLDAAAGSDGNALLALDYRTVKPSGDINGPAAAASPTISQRPAGCCLPAMDRT